MTFSAEKKPLLVGDEEDEHDIYDREVYMHPIEVQKQLVELWGSRDGTLVAVRFISSFFSLSY